MNTNDEKETVAQLKQRQTTSLTSITKQRTRLSKLISNVNNISQVKEELEIFNDKFEAYVDVHLQYMEEITSEEIIEKEERRYEDRERSVFEFRNQVLNWIAWAEDRLVSSYDSVSQVGSSRASRITESCLSSNYPSSVLTSRSSKASKLSPSSKVHKSSNASKFPSRSQVPKSSNASKFPSSPLQVPKSSNAPKFPSSSQVSRSSSLTKVRAQVAELLVEKEMLRKKQNLKAAEEELALQTKIEKAKARERAFAETDQVPMGTQQSCRKTLLTPAAFEFKFDEPMLQPNFNSGVQGHEPERLRNELLSCTTPKELHNETKAYDPHILQQETMVNSYQQLTAAITLPQPKIQVFKGDPVEYASFIMAFTARIEPRATSDADRLYYLEQHLEGEPKELISGCLYLEPTEGYAEARRLLHQQFGDAFKIATAHVNQILAWPTIRQDDSHGLRKFSLFMLKCKNAMKNIDHLGVLNHQQNMQTAVQKLPFFLQNKWRDQVIKTKSKVPSFEDLTEFVLSAAESANHPVYGREALKTETRQSKHKSSSFVTKVVSNIASSMPQRGPTTSNCVYCKGLHDIDDCEKFLKLSMKEKKDFLKHNALCFACYGMNHISKGCAKKRSCKVCNKYGHPTALHIDGFVLQKSSDGIGTAEKNMSTLNNASVDFVNNDPVVLHTILPVKVRGKDSNHVVTTYAFYDGGSGGCFITEDLKEQLGISGDETSIQLGTMHGKSVVKTTALDDLTITDLNGDNAINLPRSFTRNSIPVSHKQIPKPEVMSHWHYLRKIAERIPEYKPYLKIGLLIGSNCPAAFEPLEVLPSQRDGPYAVRLRHGWTISTPLRINVDPESTNVTVNQIAVCPVEHVKEIIVPETLIKMFEVDFNDNADQDPCAHGHSQEDKRFMKIVEEVTQHVDGHYLVPLPFRHPNTKMPNNREQALKQALWQKKKMQRDERYHAHYRSFVNGMLDKNYARRVPKDILTATPGKVWYLPHHGVYNPNKPNKIRVVFNCSSRYNGALLNDELMQGPNLTNTLIGVLQRFRKGIVAFMADVESMFHQVRVPIEQCNFLRFLWWNDGNLNTEIEEYQMLVHPFGATSSPSCCNYALRRSAKDSEKLYGSNATETVLRNFYVDDCLKSVDDEATAIQLIADVRSTCAHGGFHLTKFICNRRSVIQTLPAEECSSKLVTQDLAMGEYNLPIERALGIQWCVESDVLGFHITVTNKPPTRRGILSTVSSIYDPLGFVAPFTMPAKRILQSLCKVSDLGWDDEIPSDQKLQWEEWISQLPLLERIMVERCYKPPNFGEVISEQVHIFCDASTTGYGSSAYLRLVNDQGSIHCSFLFGKSRLAPIKSTTVPRLELTAATLSVRIGQMIKKELEKNHLAMIYHTDSTTVLRYILNEQRRFKVFVANRVQLIRDCSNPRQWRYVPSPFNPADEASRGVNVTTLADEPQRWLKGPAFLWKEEKEWPNQLFTTNYTIPEDDQELKCISTCAVDVCESAMNTLQKLVSYFSSWHRLKKAIAVYLHLKELLKQKCKKYVAHNNTERKPPFSLLDIESAENAIIKYVQNSNFNSEIKSMTNATKAENTRSRVTREVRILRRSNSIRRLDPYIDYNGILRVGGRLRRANLSEEVKHPIILPRRSEVTTMIIRQAHEELGHAGRAHVLSKLREKYWIIGANAATRHLIYKCVICRRIKAPLSEQKMSDLPSARLQPAPPFTYVGMDYFGPFLIKEGRKTNKRYGVVFTCLVSRAVHIELSSTLDTDSCIQAIRRLIARRGPVREMHSDNGTNLVGAEKELRQAIQEINDKGIREKLLKYCIDWKFNPPTASHMGGSWERQIRSVRKILAGLLGEHGERMNEESLHTLMCEVESIINSRPLTLLSSEPDDMLPLTPSQLLTMKPDVLGYPPGDFERNDLYLRRRWRRTQYLANLFWSRWRKEYLTTLQERHKWCHKRRNLKIGDVVLLKDDNTSRNTWPLGIVLKTETDAQGLVRAVEVKTQASKFRRPVTRLVLLVPSEDN